MSFRLAAYAVCVEDGRVLLARYVSPTGDTNWTLPGGRVEQEEDPFDAVVREVAEETGCVSVVERLLGVDSRVIPPRRRGWGSHTRTSVSSTRSGSLAASCGRSRTARPPNQSGRRYRMSPLSADRRWSTSGSHWR